MIQYLIYLHNATQETFRSNSCEFWYTVLRGNAYITSVRKKGNLREEIKRKEKIIRKWGGGEGTKKLAEGRETETEER